MNTSVFNHKYGHYSEAIGISNTRLIELNELLKEVLKDSEKKYVTESLKTERILSEGLSIMEVAYVFNMYGRLHSLPEAFNKHTEKFKNMQEAISKSPLGEMIKDLTGEDVNMAIVNVSNNKFDELFYEIVKDYNSNMK